MVLGVAVIGLGHWGPNHVRVFDSLKEVQVVAAADRDESRWRRIQDRYPRTRCFADPEQAIACPGVDAVIVATPTATHYDVVRAALAAGKHVLCEKPLATASEHAWQLVSMADEHDVQLMTGHIFLFNPGIEYLRDAVADERTGQVYYLNGVRTNLGPFREDVNAAWDLASHDIYIFDYLLAQRPQEVAATGAGYLRAGVEDLAFLTLKYPNGVLGHVHVSWLDPKKIRQITLVAEHRMVTWDEYGVLGPVVVHHRAVVREKTYDTFGEFQLLTREGDAIVPRIPSREPLGAQAQEFVRRCLHGGEDPKAGAREGAEVVDILVAATRSLREGGGFVDVSYGG